MRILIQRVRRASVSIGGTLKSAIGPGLLVFVGIEAEDGEEDIYLDEFRDEIDDWVIEALKDLGLGTAKAVLNASPEVLEQADLEDTTLQHVFDVIRAEFDD